MFQVGVNQVYILIWTFRNCYLFVWRLLSRTHFVILIALCGAYSLKQVASNSLFIATASSSQAISKAEVAQTPPPNAISKASKGAETERKDTKPKRKSRHVCNFFKHLTTCRIGAPHSFTQSRLQVCSMVFNVLEAQFWRKSLWALFLNDIIIIHHIQWSETCFNIIYQSTFHHMFT